MSGLLGGMFSLAFRGLQAKPDVLKDRPCLELLKGSQDFRGFGVKA